MARSHHAEETPAEQASNFPNVSPGLHEGHAPKPGKKNDRQQSAAILPQTRALTMAPVEDPNTLLELASLVENTQDNIDQLEKKLKKRADKQEQDMSQMMKMMREMMASNIGATSSRVQRPGGNPDDGDDSSDEESRRSHSTTLPRAQPPRHLERRSQELRVERFSGSDEGPEWYAWSAAILSKLSVNADHFPTETARMAALYNHTKGEAQGYLLPRFEIGALEPFVNAEEMIGYLTGIYGNAFKQRDAETALNKLEMSATETFAEYYPRFLKLVQDSRIPFDGHLTTRLYDSLHPALKDRAIHKFTPNGSFQDFMSSVDFLDKETRRTQEQRRAALAQSRATGSLAPRAAPVSPQRGLLTFPAVNQSSRLSPAPAPARKALPAPVNSSSVTCYNCRGPGHIAKDCSHPRSATNMSVMEVEILEQYLGVGFFEDEDHATESAQEAATEFSEN